MADNQVTLGIEIETSAAEKSLKTLEKNSVDSANKMQKAFDGLKTVAAAAVALFAAKGVFDFFAAGVEGAIAQEQAMARLQAQMEATGENTEDAAKAFNDLASELESTTKFGDDAILSAAALAKSYGITNDEAIKLTRAATDLASATGDTLEGAVEQLTASYSGNVKAIAKLVPGIKGLTKEQLAAGGAVDLLAARFAGAAQKEILTYAGAIKQATNAFENYRESFGTIITSNKTVIAAINGIGKMFQALQKVVEDNQETFTAFINLGIRASVVAIGLLVDSIRGLVLAFGAVATVAADVTSTVFSAFADIARAIEKVTGDTGLVDFFEAGAQSSKEFSDDTLAVVGKIDGVFDDITGAVDNFSTTVFEAGEETSKSMSKAEKTTAGYKREVIKTAEEVAKLRDEGKKFLESLSIGAASESEKAIIEAQKSFSELENLRKKGALTEAQAREASFKITQIQIQKTNSLIDKSFKETTDKAKQVAQEARAAIESAAADPIKFGIAKLEIPPIQVSFETQQVAAAGVGIVGKILEGAAGAKSLISAGAAAIGDALIPGIGGAVGGIVSKLAEGPEATKKFVKEFVAAIPVIVEAIADSAPVFVEALIDSLVNKGGAIRIGIAIARAMSGEAILKNIGKQIGVSFGSSFNGQVLGQKIASGFLTVGDKLAATFSNFGAVLYNSIFGAFIQGGQQIVSFLGTAFAQIPAAFATAGEAILQPIRDFFTADLSGLVSSGFESVINLFRVDFPALVSSAFEPVIAFLRQFQVKAPEPVRAAVASVPGGSDAVRLQKAILTGGLSELHNGGLVYAAGGFKPRGTDTVPAMLTPGEMVLNRGQQSELFNLANNGGGGNNELLERIIDLLTQPQTTEVTAQVNGKAIADIVLQQSRQRARLTA